MPTPRAQRSPRTPRQHPRGGLGMRTHTEPARAPETRDALVSRLTGVEWRDQSGAGPDQMTVRGHALTWDTPYDMWLFTESVARGALDDALAKTPDVHLLWDHDYSRA